MTLKASGTTSHSADIILTPIGIIHSPYRSSSQTPRQGRRSGTTGNVEVFPSFAEALKGIERYRHIMLLFWMDKARRRELYATPPGTRGIRGVFATRSPHRPNPIGVTIVELLGRRENILVVKGLDTIDGTPALDIKPYVFDIDSVQPHAS